MFHLSCTRPHILVEANCSTDNHVYYAHKISTLAEADCSNGCSSIKYCPYGCICDGKIPIPLQPYLGITAAGSIVLKYTSVPVKMVYIYDEWCPGYKCSYCDEYEACIIVSTNIDRSDGKALCKMCDVEEYSKRPFRRR